MARYAALRSTLERRAKSAVHAFLLQRDLDVVRHPPMRRLVRLMSAVGVDLVFDVGANTGQFASELRSAGYPGPIVSFEPLGDAFAALATVAARDGSWRALHTAVGAEQATTIINRAGNSWSSSLLPMTSVHERAAPDSRIVGTESIEVDTLDAVVDRERLTAASALLKIDTQGYERAVLDGAEATLRSCALVKVELSLAELYEGQPLYLDLIHYLRDRGFAMCGVEGGFVDTETGQMLQFDGIFARSDVLAGLLSPAAR